MSCKAPKYKLLNKKDTERMLKDFKGERSGWVQVGDKKWFFPHRYIEQGEGFYNFEARASDTWVLSYPRSGTTWTQELVWLVANDMDFATANTKLLTERFPFLEFSMFVHPEVSAEFLEYHKGDERKQEAIKEMSRPGYEVLANLASPRFIKSHFPMSLLPNILDSGSKIVYVARNPKDVAVSLYKLNQAFKTQGYEGDFAQFWYYFRNDLTAWSPYWEHLKEAWAVRDHTNFLFLFYEDLKQNLGEVIERVAKFLGKSYTQEQIAKLEDHLNFKNFRKNLMVNSQDLKDLGVIQKESDFIRKGISGGWKDYFDEELEADADKWINDNLKDTNFQYPLANNNCRF